MSVFYISAWGKAADCGIYRCETDPAGRVLPVGFTRLRGAGYPGWSTDRRTLYFTSLTAEDGGAVSAFAVASDGTLRHLNTLPSRGLSCCHLAAAPGGKFLYAANYRTGSLAEFSLRPDGSLAELSQLVEHRGSGPVADRQASAHVHYAMPTPDGRFIAVCDLGCDTLSCYPFDPGRGIDRKNPRITAVAPGRGPRHLAFHPTGKFAFLVNELGNTLISYRYADGGFDFVDEQSLLPECVSCRSTGSAVRVSPDGRFVISGSRGFDSAAVFAVAPDGKLERRQLLLTGGSSPREMNYLPGGKLFAIANEFSAEVRIFSFDPESGTLEPNGCRLSLPRPLGIIF